MGYQFPNGQAPKLTETVIMLAVLALIDVVMISNLLIMVIVGGYETFISRMNLEGHPDETGVAEPRERLGAEGRSSARAIIGHQLDPPAEELSSARRTTKHRGADVADDHPHRLPALGRSRSRLHRPAAERCSAGSSTSAASLTWTRTAAPTLNLALLARRRDRAGCCMMPPRLWRDHPRQARRAASCRGVRDRHRGGPR
jgi:hypothetical protein